MNLAGAAVELGCVLKFIALYWQVRRGGQVQAPREKSAGYGGEATGIKAKISKSRRF